MSENGLLNGATLGDLLVRAIGRGGDRVAFVDGARRITYREFGQDLSTMAQALAAQGLAPGDPIATLAGNRYESFLVTATAHLMSLRLTGMHPLGSEEDHAYILEDAGIRALVFDPDAFGPRAEALLGKVTGLAALSLGPGDAGVDLLAGAANNAPGPLEPRGTSEDLATLPYTGGTSGRPKGVMLTHRARVAMVMAQLAEWEWPREARFLVTTPITHAAGSTILTVLNRAGTVFIEPAFSPERFIEAVERHRITTTFVVPTMLYRLLDHPGLDAADLSSLEVVIYGAAPISPARLAEGIERIGPVFMQLYGQTEAPNCISVLRRDDHDPVRHPERLASCGLAIGPIQVAVLDDDGRRVPDGEVGELCARGPLLMNGYWNRPEETARALRHGWLYTGDLARRDGDGFLYIVDRSKDMIITGGFNVYPREVEDALAEHPAVAAAAVIGVPDATWGEAVKALVVLRPGASVDEAALIAHVRERKGPVQSPKTVQFVDSIAVTGLGKPDKKALRAQYGTPTVTA